MPKPSRPLTKEAASYRQIRYLEILFDDLGFNRVARNFYLSRELGREITAIEKDQLGAAEASRLIDSLVEQKERNNQSCGSKED